MSTGYWSTVNASRITRRRAIIATGSGALGAAFLAACGGDDKASSSSTAKQPASGLLSPAVDESKQAKRGGVWLDYLPSDFGTMDPHLTSNPHPSNWAFSRMMRVQSGYMEPAKGTYLPDAAESTEYSPDKLTLTLKLRSNLTWHNLPPVNGRPVTVEDVVFSYERLKSIGTNRGDFDSARGGPIESVKATDSKTIVIKLNQVYSGLFALLASGGSGSFLLAPTEADGKYDPRTVAIGSGPWMMKSYQPSVGVDWVRHEGWHSKDLLFADEVKGPIVSEYATGLAQFTTGAIYTYPVSADDILPTKRKTPTLELYQNDVAGPPSIAGFGWNPTMTNPFKDQRLRQALSMSWDRDLWISTFYNVEKFSSEGIPMTSGWHSAIPLTDVGAYLDPKSKDFGPNSKYYQYNVAEAKKLVAAAGFANGVEVPAYHITTNQSGTDFPKWTETLKSFASEVGLKLTTRVVDYNTELKKYTDSQGDYAGMNFRGLPSGNPDVAEKAIQLFTPVGGPLYSGFFPDGGTFQKGDPKLTEVLMKTRQEFDPAKRNGLLQDFQRMAAETQYIIRYPGGSNSFTLAWPALRNQNVYHGDRLYYLGQWIDPSKAPIAKS